MMERQSSKMVNSPISPGLLKIAQMQGRAPGTHSLDGCRCEAY